MGSRGLSSTGAKVKPKGWKLNSKNASRYGIELVYKPSNKLTKQELNKIQKNLDSSLDTINTLAEMIGLHTDFIPSVWMSYGKVNDAYGNCRLSLDNRYDAEINLFHKCILGESLDSAAHEMVHGLEAMFIKRNITNVADRVNAWQDHFYSEIIVRNALVAEKLQSSKESKLNFTAWHNAAHTIYRTSEEQKGAYKYAHRGPHETITTSVQMVMRYGDNASPFAKAVVKELKREYQRQYRKYKKSK